MSFDPEKVERLSNALIVPTQALGGRTPAYMSTAKVNGVRASDYEQLLQLYREEKAKRKATTETLVAQIKKCVDSKTNMLSGY
jgi:hypothetical protein